MWCNGVGIGSKYKVNVNVDARVNLHVVIMKYEFNVKIENNSICYINIFFVLTYSTMVKINLLRYIQDI